MRRPKTETHTSRLSDLLEGDRKYWLIAPACVLLAGTGWWAYTALMTVPPPDVKTATVEDVVDFVGNSHGFARMSIPQREEFLVRTWQHYAQAPPDQRQQLGNALNRMSPTSRRVFTDATFDIMRTHVMRHAEEYARQRSPVAKAQYIDRAIRDFERMRGDLTGAGVLAPGMNVTTPFQAEAPTNSGELQKLLVTKTTPQERAKAEPFVDKVAERVQQLKNPVERRRFDGG